MAEPLAATDAEDSALRLLKAVRLGHIEVALQLLQSGIRLSRPLHKEDFEADAPSEVEREREFLRGSWQWRSVWRSSWWWWDTSAHARICPLGHAQRSVWRTFVPRTESDSDDSFSDEPEEWRDPLGNAWREEGEESGVSFFSWCCQGVRCHWAADWNRPINECRARVSTPTTQLLLRLAQGDQLTALAISEDGVARLLDAAILLGQAEAAAALVASYPRTYRTLRFWAIEELITKTSSLRSSDLAFPDQVMAAVAAGADVSSIIHPTSRCSFLFQVAVEGGRTQMAEAMQRNGFSSLSSYGDAFVCYCESMEQFQLREAPLAVAARVGAGLGHLRVRCVSSCTTPACTARRVCFDVSLVGFAVLAGDVQHIDALMGQMGHGCSLAFLEMPCERGQHTWRSMCEMLSGHCHLCGAASVCTTFCCGGGDERRYLASPDQRRRAAVSALRQAFGHCCQRAGSIYGPTLIQWARKLIPGNEIVDLVKHVLAYACELSEIAGELSDLKFGISKVAAGNSL